MPLTTCLKLCLLHHQVDLSTFSLPSAPALADDDYVRVLRYRVDKLDVGSQLFLVSGRFKQPIVRKKYRTFVADHEEAGIDFDEDDGGQEHLKRFSSFLRQKTGGGQPFTFDYGIRPENLFAEGHDVDIDRFPCILRAALGSKMISGQDGHEISFPGVTTGYTYRGTKGSTFTFHREDKQLYSINILLSGSPKVWTIVPPQYHDRAIACLREDLRESQWYDGVECRALEMHKNVFCDPEWFKAKGIPVYVIVQEVGQAVIVEPMTLHLGINTGLNFAVATNFAIPHWLQYGIDALVVSMTF